jgi:hypothetical protein
LFLTAGHTGKDISSTASAREMTFNSPDCGVCSAQNGLILLAKKKEQINGN